MQNPHCIIICFDYGVEIKWISGDDDEGRDEIHTIVFEEISGGSHLLWFG